MWVILAALAFMIVGGAAFGIYYNISLAKEEGDEWRHRTFTTPMRFLLLGCGLLTIASVVVATFAVINSEPISGGISIMVCLAGSLFAAYTCSPLRLLLYSFGDMPETSGCAFFLGMPILIISSTMSLVLIILCGWLFALLAAFRASTVKFRIAAIAVIVAVAAIVCGVFGMISLNEMWHSEDLEATHQAILEKVEAAYESFDNVEVTFTEKEQEYAENQGCKSCFYIKEAREMLAERFCEMNKHKAYEEMIDAAVFMVTNDIDLPSDNEGDIGIYFSKEFIRCFGDYIRAKGEQTDRYGDEYRYKDYRFYFGMNNSAVFMTDYETEKTYYMTLLEYNEKQEEIEKSGKDIDYFGVDTKVLFKNN